MRLFRLTLECSLCLAVFATAGCRRKSGGQVVGESPAAQSPSRQEFPLRSYLQVHRRRQVRRRSHRLSSDQRSICRGWRTAFAPQSFWITVFDSSGKLLRTQTAFFISGDGRFITTAHAIEDGVNAVAKMAAGEIHNVDGILASSATLDLAILQADAKRGPFLRLNKTANLEPGTHVGVVGSALAGTAEAARETTISKQQPDDVEIVATYRPIRSGRQL